MFLATQMIIFAFIKETLVMSASDLWEDKMVRDPVLHDDNMCITYILEAHAWAGTGDLGPESMTALAVSCLAVCL